jgi:poly(3-hydroxyalkanoate) depolymerase
MMTLETSYMRIRGQRMRVAIQGSGPPLLLMTGIGANIEMWRPLMALIENRQVIAFDAPGSGRSDVGGPFRMRGLAELVSELLEKLQVTRTDVLGYSWGGAVAQQFVHDHPERVDRLVLAGTMCGVGSLPAPLHVLPHMLHPLRYYSKRYLKAVSPTIYGGRSAREGPELHEHAAARDASPPSLMGYTLQMLAISGWTSLPWLHTVQAPTLIMAGECDPIVLRPNAELLRLCIPNARLEIVPEAGHLFLFDQPQDSAELLEAFLSDASPRGHG